jgi:hypothetical protein
MGFRLSAVHNADHVCGLNNQGDQIVRLFACWAVVFFRKFFLNLYTSGKILWATFPRCN